MSMEVNEILQNSMFLALPAYQVSNAGRRSAEDQNENVVRQ